MTFGFSQMTNAFTDAFAAIDFKGAKFGFKKSVFPSLLYLFFIAKYTDWQPGINEILKKPLGIQQPEPSLLAQDTQAPFPSFVYFFSYHDLQPKQTNHACFSDPDHKTRENSLELSRTFKPLSLTVPGSVNREHQVNQVSWRSGCDLRLVSRSSEKWWRLRAVPCPLFVLSFSCASFPAIKLLCSRGNEALREHEATSQNWCKIFQ